MIRISLATLVLYCVLFATASFAQLRDVYVPTDKKARYSILLLDTDTGRNALVVVSKRVGSSGTSFALREVNCYNATFRYLSDADTLDELMVNIDDSDRMAPLVKGSISYYIAKAVCEE